MLPQFQSNSLVGQNGAKSNEARHLNSESQLTKSSLMEDVPIPAEIMNNILSNPLIFTGIQSQCTNFIPFPDTLLGSSNISQGAHISSSNVEKKLDSVMEKGSPESPSFLSVKGASLSNKYLRMKSEANIKEEHKEKNIIPNGLKRKGKQRFQKKYQQNLLHLKKRNGVETDKIVPKEETNELDIKEEEIEGQNCAPISIEKPPLLGLTEEFPEWDLGQIITFLLSSDSEKLEQTQKELIEKRVEKSLLEHDTEADVNSIGLKIKKTRAWKNKVFSKNSKPTSMDVLNNKSTYIKRIQALTGLKEVDLDKAFKLLQENEMEPKKVIWKIKKDAEYYRRFLSIKI